MTSEMEIDRSLTLDAHSLDRLRLQAKQDPQAALKSAARQFEAVFLQTLLKSMRDASPRDGLMDSDQTRAYTEMLDQQIAQSMAARGIGLADKMLKQLTRASAPAAPNATTSPGTGAATSAEPAAGPAAPRAAADFLMRMKGYAADASRQTGIPARFLLAQAALESGWGRHEIRAADGTRSFNVFGIKASRSWSGATVEAMTVEYAGGVARRVAQKFRAYGSYAEAFQDYAKLIGNNPRYAPLIGRADGPGFALGLQRAGYASDPQYADKLTRVLNGVSA